MVVTGAAVEPMAVVATLVTATAEVVVTFVVEVVPGDADEEEATGRNGSRASGSIDATATPVDG